ncbi:calcium/sodium antiporter [Candidatus Saccharibacteria bacterium]|nr:calcium/sodium antiporter [Candidatus Saccharibacteria bacterium]
MEIFLQILILVVGFVVIVKGADWLVSGASSTASNFKVSKQLIGLTIVAFGTSAPELAVSFASLISGKTDVLIALVIGSNTLNALLLVGLAAVVAPPILIKRATISKELPLLLLISASIIVLLLDSSISNLDSNTFSRSDALICLLLFAVFIYYIINILRQRKLTKKQVEKPKYKLGKSLLLTLLGLTGVIVGGELVVNSATEIATTIGISERIISLTIINFGTALPEIVTTIVAAKKHESELLVGSLVGSNIFNICIVLGLPVAIFGTIALTNFDLVDLMMPIISSLVLWWVCRRGSHGEDGKIKRSEGFLLLAVFALYYSYVIYGALA